MTQQKHVCDAETAEADIIRMIDAFDLEDPREADQESGAVIFDALVKAIMRGRLSVDDEGHPIVQTGMQTPSELKFSNQNWGRVMLEGSKAGDDQVRKMQLMLGSMCGQGKEVFAKMGKGPYRVCEALFVVFAA